MWQIITNCYRVKLIKNLLEHKKWLFLIASTYTICIIALCLVSFRSLPEVNVGKGFDKVVHSLFHFGLTTIWFLYFRIKYLSQKTIKPILKAFLFSLALGICIEFAQDQFTVTRHADIWDVVANLAGSIASVIFITIMGQILKKTKVKSL